MREGNIEKYLKDEIEKRGGMCLKWTSPGTNGVPDRICVLPYFEIFFVELKAPGKKPRLLQREVIKRLCDLGAYVAVVDSRGSVDCLLRYLDLATAHNRYEARKNHEVRSA